MTVSAHRDRVIRSLDAFASIPAWLAAGTDGEAVARALRRRVPALADGALLACRADRLRAKGDEWLARYELTLATPDGPPRDVVLTGTLYRPGRDVPQEAVSVASSGGSFGQAWWGCWLPRQRLYLRTETHDAALPALDAIVDPRRARDLVEPLLRAAHYDGAVVDSCDPEVVRYKPGSRCTVVVRLDYRDRGARTPPDMVVCKTHHGDKGATAQAAMQVLWDHRETWQEHVSLAEPLGFLPRQRVLVQGPVPGEETLKEVVRTAFSEQVAPTVEGRLGDRLADTARGLAAVHTSGVRYGETVTVEQELDKVAEVVDRLALSVPELRSAARPLLRGLARVSLHVPADAEVPSHVSFRPAQVLAHAGGVSFIDFDDAAMAEPAVDVGRFRAGLRDIAMSTPGPRPPRSNGSTPPARLEAVDALCEHFSRCYAEHATVSPTRVLLWESVELTMLMLHAWTKVRVARLPARLDALRHQLRLSGLTAGGR